MHRRRSARQIRAGGAEGARRPGGQLGRGRGSAMRTASEPSTATRGATGRRGRQREAQPARPKRIRKRLSQARDRSGHQRAPGRALGQPRSARLVGATRLEREQRIDRFGVADVGEQPEVRLGRQRDHAAPSELRERSVERVHSCDPKARAGDVAAVLHAVEVNRFSGSIGARLRFGDRRAARMTPSTRPPALTTCPSRKPVPA